MIQLIRYPKFQANAAYGVKSIDTTSPASAWPADAMCSVARAMDRYKASVF
jgi:hypothetical protein